MGPTEKWLISALRACASPRSQLSDLTASWPRHADAALEWLLLAQRVGREGGIPAFYDILRGRWSPCYPETTGYTIPTFLACAAALRRPGLREAALSMADYLLTVRTAEGGVGHWGAAGDARSKPVVFDTGQAIFGWLAVWRETGAAAYLEAAVRAADWLTEIQEPSGAWTRHQHLGTVKVIDTRVAWALLQVAEVVGTGDYLEAARRNLDWALCQQQPNGWFRKASFVPAEDPFTHTIAYTAEGLLESGIRLDDHRLVEAAENVARRMLAMQRADGWLAGSYDAAWRPTARYSCLTGNCQMALLWLRLHSMSHEDAYRDAAFKAIAFVASTQDLRTSNLNIRGAIAGSYPIYGRYARLLYPNWAAKFFLDALLALGAADGWLDSACAP